MTAEGLVLQGVDSADDEKCQLEHQMIVTSSHHVVCLIWWTSVLALGAFRDTHCLVIVRSVD